MDPFGTVKDSSIWQSSYTANGISSKDPFIRIGIIKCVNRDTRNGEIKYVVQIQDRNDSIDVNAKLLRRLGGVFNYEDVVGHGYKYDDKPDPVRAFDAKAGDAVLVAFLNGESREAVILGGLMHPARESTLSIDKGPQYVSEFNGVETHINETGEYKVTFKGIPTNIKVLDEKPSKKLPKPTYDIKVGTTFFKFDKTGSFEVNDMDESGLQNLRIDKPKGTITVNSGKIQLMLTKEGEKVDLKCKTLTITSTDQVTATTKKMAITASDSMKLKSPKVAIGKEGIELLDQLHQLIDAIGLIVAISPVGPCSALQTTGQWTKVADIQSKIKEITGTIN